MAGYINRDNYQANSNQSFFNKVFRDINILGTKYESEIIKNSKAYGVAEKVKKDFKNLRLNQYDDDFYKSFLSIASSDSTLKDSAAYFDKSYEEFKNDITKYILDNEIDDILTTLSNECIVDSPDGKICTIQYNSASIKESLKEEITNTFNMVYSMYGFDDHHTMWDYFKKWLIYGYLAFEIVYDSSKKNITGFRELDPSTLKPTVYVDSTGTLQKVFIQNSKQGQKEVVLTESEIVYISFSNALYPTKVSYAQQLIKPFNLLKIMEMTRISWNVINGQFRTAVNVPVTGLSKNNSKQSLSQLISSYNDSYFITNDTNELVFNGTKTYPFTRTFWYPVKDGEQVTTETVGGDGPDLSDMEALKYFVFKLRDASMIPYNRFDKENSAGYELAAEGMMRDELRFSKLINQFRYKFSNLLLKPMFIQLYANRPELMNDRFFKQNISIVYNKENLFDELKEAELIQKRVDLITTLKDSLVTQDKDMNDAHFFDLNFLVEKILIEKFIKFTKEDLTLNEKHKQITSIEQEGYSRSDATKIFDGESRKKFKKKEITSEPIATDEDLENMDSEENYEE